MPNTNSEPSEGSRAGPSSTSLYLIMLVCDPWYFVVFNTKLIWSPR